MQLNTHSLHHTCRRFLTLTAAVVLSVFQTVAQQRFNMRAIADTGLPLIVVETIGGEEPSCDYVYAPPGSMGASITNVTKVPGRVQMIVDGAVVFDSGDYVKDESGMTIRMRGNWSAFMDKHPFKIKLEKKGDMLRRGDQRFADKNWVLLCDYPFSLCPMVGNKLAELCRAEWQPQGQYVNLVINDDYRGMYYLVETVRRNKDCRMDVDKNTGYITELDPYWWNEPLHFTTLLTTDSPSVRYTLKYPDPEDITEAQLNWIREKTDHMEHSLLDGTYPGTIDVESWVRWILAHDILGTKDAEGSNLYLTLYDNAENTKFKLGPLWDFDTIFMTPGEWSRLHGKMLFPWYWGDANGLFTHTYYAVFDQVKDWIFDEMISWLKAYGVSSEARAIDRSILYDGMRWDDGYISVGQRVNEAIQWFQDRKQWMTEQCELERNAIRPIVRPLPSSGKTYDLSGRQVARPHTKGIYLQQGRKVVVKP